MKGIMICTIRVVLSNLFNVFHNCRRAHLGDCLPRSLFLGGIIYHVQ
jgi:hypothetical protein